MLTLALNSVMTNVLVVFFLLVCVVMVLIVLIQRSQGGGLSGAFGSGGGQGAGQTAFGTKTGDVLTWATVSIFFIYLLAAIALNYASRPSTAGAVTEPTLSQPDEPPSETETLPTLPGTMEEQSELPPLDRGDIPSGTLPEAETSPEEPADQPPLVDPASAEQPA